ncbi:MAG: glycoside hydrolase family 13 protein [Anaerolineaceae bacterium]|nr:glycoside hydrolase family 13 protein [Anaerolineaceae bacterium]
MTVPDWVQDSVFYQIFPDRFENGDKTNDPPNVEPWESIPTTNGFQGGDLQGIIERLYYLLDLGVDALYLNPIFLSPSNHRYNTTDYFQIDHKLGTLSVFHTLLDVVHRNRMRLILDGVFNHCGRGFFAFSDLLENQSASPYKDWFYVKRFPVDAYSPGDATSYLAWWKFKSLPKLNIGNPLVRQYVLSVARYWTEQGIDGWRLDVPNEIDDDSFWADFRDAVKRINTDAYLVGEIWDGNKRWVDDRHFDGLMNYPLRVLILDLLNGKITPEYFASHLNQHHQQYASENRNAMYNLLGSHDTERLLTVTEGNIQKAKLAYLILMTQPGSPAIYYGDEVGLSGGKDPDCRKAFPWNESKWNSGLRSWIKNLIRIRKNNVALRRGEIKINTPRIGDGWITWSRQYEDQECIVVINPSPTVKHPIIHVRKQGIYRDMITLEEHPSIDSTIQFDLDPWSGCILMTKS